MAKNKFYITTAIDYVNAKPHIGHVFEKILADVIARYHRQRKEEVFFLTGSDEHGLKIQQAAEAAGKEPQVFVDEMVKDFIDMGKNFNLSWDNYIRTTEENHIKAAQELGVPIKECAVVSDSIVDTQAGKAAGIKTIAVLTGLFTRKELEEWKPDFILKNINCLPDLLIGFSEKDLDNRNAN